MGPMASRHVALLRGVNNAGKSTRVSMADLRVLFERLGFRDVRTLLNSGNVVFSVPDSRRPVSSVRRGDVRGRIEKALAARLGLDSRVIVLSRREVAVAVQDNPLAGVAVNPSWLLVVVPGKPSDRERLRPLLEERWAPERLAIGRRAAYLWCARGVADSRLWSAVDRALGRSGTARNISTMMKLMALVEGE